MVIRMDKKTIEAREKGEQKKRRERIVEKSRDEKS